MPTHVSVYWLFKETLTAVAVNKPQGFNSLSVSVATDAGLNLDSGSLLFFLTYRLQTIHLRITTH